MADPSMKQRFRRAEGEAVDAPAHVQAPVVEGHFGHDRRREACLREPVDRPHEQLLEDRCAVEHDHIVAVERQDVGLDLRHGRRDRDAVPRRFAEVSPDASPTQRLRVSIR